MNTTAHFFLELHAVTFCFSHIFCRSAKVLLDICCIVKPRMIDSGLFHVYLICRVCRLNYDIHNLLYLPLLYTNKDNW